MAVDRALLDKVRELLRRELHIEVDDHQVDLFEEGLIDSLLFVDLLVKLETEFGVHVSLEELEIENFRSIERIAAFIGKRRAAA